MNTKALDTITRHAALGEAILALVKDSGLARVKHRRKAVRRKKKAPTAAATPRAPKAPKKPKPRLGDIPVE